MQINPVYLSSDSELTGLSWRKLAFFSLILGFTVLLWSTLHTLIYSPEIHLLKQFWFWLDVTMMIGLLTCICVAIKRDAECVAIIETLQRMREDDYISLENIVYWDQIQLSVFSVTWAICFMEIGRLFVYLEGGFLVMSLTLRLSVFLIMTYFLIIFVIVVAFACAGHIFFGSAMFEFSTFWRGVWTLVGQVSFSEL